MFQNILFLLLFIIQFPHHAANSYGKSCNSDSSCDAHQKCLSAICRCNQQERRFWTGETCAICAKDYSFTFDRCYKYFNDLKTWSAARAYCRSRYADLFTWRDNHDEQFIRPVMHHWIISNSVAWAHIWHALYGVSVGQHYVAWSGATVTSLNPFTTKWTDPKGMKLDLTSAQWCDPTKHAAYTLTKEPTRGNKKVANGTENEECVTYNFGTPSMNLLCLADDYCSQKYPFICEMNDASMKLAVETHYGDNGSPLAGTNNGGNGDSEIYLPPIESEYNLQDNKSPSASGTLSNTNVLIFIGLGVLLVVGAIAGYIVIRKKQAGTGRDRGGRGGVPRQT
ncbi:hypothetical protein I4U23_019251 [Adineta vaga]|nr:hypothetical protein I4U23_019251 [Adineta vaga]